MVRKIAARFALGSVGLLAGQLAYVVKRDLPSFEGFDASASVGDPNLPALRIATLGDSTLTGPGLDRSDDIWIRQAAAMLAERYHIRSSRSGSVAAKPRMSHSIRSPASETLISPLSRLVATMPCTAQACAKRNVGFARPPRTCLNVLMW